MNYTSAVEELSELVAMRLKASPLGPFIVTSRVAEPTFQGRLFTRATFYPELEGRAVRLDVSRADHVDRFVDAVIPKAIEKCFCLLTETVVTSTGETLSAASDGVITIDATGGLIFEHFIEVESRLEYIDDSATAFLSAEECEKLRLESKLPGKENWVETQHGKISKLLGFRIAQISAKRLPSNNCERSCFVLNGPALAINLSLRADDGVLLCDFTGVRICGENVLHIRTSAVR